MTFERYFVFLYKTTEYSGELLAGTEEGNNFWISIDEMKKLPDYRKSININEYLPIFLEGKYSEVFGSWYDNEPWELISKAIPYAKERIISLMKNGFTLLGGEGVPKYYKNCEELKKK